MDKPKAGAGSESPHGVRSSSTWEVALALAFLLVLLESHTLDGCVYSLWGGFR